MPVVFEAAKLPRLSFKQVEELLYIGDTEFNLELDNRVILADIHRQVLNSYVQRVQSTYSAISSTYISVADDVEINMRNASKLKRDLGTLRALNISSIDKSLGTVDTILRQKEDKAMSAFNTGLAELNAERDSIRVALEERQRQQISSIETQRSSLLSAYKNKLSGLFEQMEEITAGFEDIEYLERVYQVEHSDVSIEVDKMDLNEFKKLIKLSSYALRVVKAKNPIAAGASVLYLPAVMRVSMQREFSCIYLAVLCLTLAFLPWLLGIVALLFFINLGVNVYQAFDNQRILQIAYIMMRDNAKIRRQIDLLLNKQPAVMELIRQLRELEFIDLEANIAVAQRDVDNRIEAYKAASPEPRLKNVRTFVQLKDNMDTLTHQIENKSAEHTGRVEHLITKLNLNYIAIMTAIRKHSESLPLYGCDIRDTAVLTASLRVAEKRYEGMPVGYELYDLPLQNYLFRYKDDRTRAVLVNLMKLLYMNMFNNVGVGNLITIITDPLKAGVDFQEWYDNGLERVLKLESDNFQKSFDSIKEITQKNMFALGAKTFEENNRDAEKQGSVPLPYHLWIVVSSAEELAEKKDFIPFLQISAERGVLIWVLQPTFLDDKGNLDPRRTLEMDIRFEDAGYFFNKGERIDYASKTAANVAYSLALGLQAKKYYMEIVKQGKVVIVDYETAFRQRVIPDDKIWSFNTVKGIDLHYGFLGGDPNTPMVETLGDDAVHCLMGGQTGAGKSATINMVLANLLYMYPPEWLELVMIDFKRVEFNIYTGDFLIPHASIISGTKDGEYALSIFDWVLAEMARRQKLIGKYKFQKIQDWNQAVVDGKIKEPVIPRILMLFDEFQAMFVAVEDDKLDLIKKRIMALSKEARALGVHLWFTSQSLKGTMSDDILEQFKMRACLSVPTAETSNSVLGNDAASTLVGKGWIYLNCNGGKPQYNHKYQIPYIPNDAIKEYLPKLIKRVYTDKDAQGRPIHHIHRGAEFYDEGEFFGKEKLDSYYKNIESLRSDQHMFILGERTSFSTNALPEHFRLLNSDGENICIHAYERPDACNIFSTILDNIKYKEEARVIATYGDEDISKLVGLSEYMSPDGVELARKANVKQLLTILADEVSRRDQVKEIEPPMYYFLIGMDKMDTEGDYNLWETTFQHILQNGPSVGIHSIVYARDSRVMRKPLRFSTHIICAKTIETESQMVLDKSLASKVNEKIAVYRAGTELTKFKIYQHNYDMSKLQMRSTFIARKTE